MTQSVLSWLKGIVGDVVLGDALRSTLEQHSGVVVDYVCVCVCVYKVNPLSVLIKSLFGSTTVSSFLSLQLRISHTVSLLTCETSSSGEHPF